MNIRKAGEEDIICIADIFKRCTDDMLQKGIRQWDYSYPLVSHVLKDVQNNSAYVMDVKGTVAAAITVDQHQDTQYKGIHWHSHDLNPVVIHRLAVAPEYQGKGIAASLCVFAEQVAREWSCRSIRLDAYSLNPASNHLYQRLGYKRAAGYCYFHYNPIPFYCYDKILG